MLLSVSSFIRTVSSVTISLISLPIHHRTGFTNGIVPQHSSCSIAPDILFIKNTIFWDITPSSPLSVNRRFGGTYCLHLQLVSCWTYFSTPKMEAICSSETSVNSQRTTRHYIPNLASYLLLQCEKIKRLKD
jgi:hypothetical protein